MKPKGKVESREFRVESILDHRLLPDGGVSYLVKWESFPVSDCTYEPEGSFCAGNEILDAYKQRKRVGFVPTCGIRFCVDDWRTSCEARKTSAYTAEGREALLRRFLTGLSAAKGSENKPSVSCNSESETGATVADAAARPTVIEFLKQPPEMPDDGLCPVLLHDLWPLAACFRDRSVFSQEAALRDYLVKVSGLKKRRQKAEQSRRRAQAQMATPVAPSFALREGVDDKKRTRRSERLEVANVIADGEGGGGGGAKEAAGAEESQRPRRTKRTKKFADELDSCGGGVEKMDLGAEDEVVVALANDKEAEGENGRSSNNNNSSCCDNQSEVERQEESCSSVLRFDGRTAKERVEALEESIMNGLVDGSSFSGKTGFQLFRLHRVAEIKEHHVSLSLDEALEMAEEEWDEDLCEEEKRWFSQRAGSISAWLRRNRRPSSMATEVAGEEVVDASAGFMIKELIERTFMTGKLVTSASASTSEGASPVVVMGGECVLCGGRELLEPNVVLCEPCAKKPSAASRPASPTSVPLDPTVFEDPFLG